MPVLEDFDVAAMTQVGAALRRVGSGVSSMEEAAARAIRYLYESLLDRSGQPACTLIRFFKTHCYADLPDDLKAAARAAAGGSSPWPTLRCLTLLASAGCRPEWNGPSGSIGHKAIPLLGADAVRAAPMIHSLVTQLGLAVREVIDEPQPNLLLERGSASFNVFHVADAVGSPMIPAQESFVVPLGIRSVVGFGGALPSGNIYAVILFSRVPISADTAQLFKTLSLCLKIAVTSHEGRVFA